jgi:ribosomal protein S9
MPLIKSKSEKAFKKNISAEIKSGRPMKQAVAIAYSVKRSAKKADGGDVTQDKKLIKKAFSLHDQQQHEDKKTNLSKLKSGGSCKW